MLFIYLTVFFAKQSPFNLMRCYVFNSWSYFTLEQGPIQKVLMVAYVLKFVSYSTPSSFRVLGLMLRSLIHLEMIFFFVRWKRRIQIQCSTCSYPISLFCTMELRMVITSIVSLYSGLLSLSSCSESQLVDWYL